MAVPSQLWRGLRLATVRVYNWQRCSSSVMESLTHILLVRSQQHPVIHFCFRIRILFWSIIWLLYDGFNVNGEWPWCTFVSNSVIQYSPASIYWLAWWYIRHLWWHIFGTFSNYAIQQVTGWRISGQQQYTGMVQRIRYTRTMNWRYNMIQDEQVCPPLLLVSCYS